jgi:hypothetical protein
MEGLGHSFHRGVTGTGKLVRESHPLHFSHYPVHDEERIPAYAWRLKKERYRESTIVSTV